MIDSRGAGPAARCRTVHRRLACLALLLGGGVGGDPLPIDCMSPRDRASYRRLLRKYGDALLERERSLLASTSQPRGGAPTVSKSQQPLLVALYVARYCRRPVSIRAAAAEIFETVEIGIFRPHKKGGATIRNIKSVGALCEELRVGLKINDQKALAAMFYSLIMWRRSRVFPESGCGIGTLNLLPRNLTRLCLWIDALIATFSNTPLVRDAVSAAAEMVGAREAGTLERSPSRAG